MQQSTNETETQGSEIGHFSFSLLPPKSVMARLLKSHALTLTSQRILSKARSSCRLFSSSQLTEEDEIPEVESGGDTGEKEDLSGGFRRLESAIYRVVVMRSAPDWLPFIPGSSYWVPPRKKLGGVAQSVMGLIGNGLMDPMTAEEAMSLTTRRGWPSSAYFIDGFLPHPVQEKPEKDIVRLDDEKH